VYATIQSVRLIFAYSSLQTLASFSVLNDARKTTFSIDFSTQIVSKMRGKFAFVGLETLFVDIFRTHTSYIFSKLPCVLKCKNPSQNIFLVKTLPTNRPFVNFKTSNQNFFKNLQSTALVIEPRNEHYKCYK
jgi:hypothetical protein